MVTEGGSHPNRIDFRTTEATLSKSGDKARRKPLTLIIACKSKDGVVLTSDTRKTDVEEDEVSDFEAKMFNIGSKYAIGCSGKSSDIEDFIDHLTMMFAGNNKDYTESELFSELRRSVRLFHKQKRIEAEEEKNTYTYYPFDFTGLFAASVKTESIEPADRFAIYKIYIKDIPLYPKDDVDAYPRRSTETNPVEKVGICKSIGTGAKAANSMLNSVIYFVGRRDVSISALSYSTVMMLCYLINGIVAYGKYTVGGGIRKKLITEDVVRDVPDEEFRVAGKNNLGQLVMHGMKEHPKLKKEGFKIVASLVKVNKEILIDFFAAMSEDKELRSTIIKYRPMLIDFLNGLKEEDNAEKNDELEASRATDQ